MLLTLNFKMSPRKINLLTLHLILPGMPSLYKKWALPRTCHDLESLTNSQKS